MVEEDLEIGINVLAMIHGGELDISCYDCNPDKQKDLYCSGVSEYPIIDTDIGEFYSCPIKWLTRQVYDWYDEYSYLEMYPAKAPSYDDVNPRYWECVKIYKNTINKIERDRLSGKTSKVDNNRKSSNSLSKLKQEFDKKKSK